MRSLAHLGLRATSVLAGWTSPWPARCQVCGRWPAQAVCEPCLLRWAATAARCTRCAHRLSTPASPCPDCGHLNKGAPAGRLRDPRTPAYLDHMVAAVDYAYPWDHIIARFKFRDEPGWAAPLAQLLLRQPAARALLAQSDLVVPVPVTDKRLSQRGYNQSWELIKSMRRRLGPSMPPCAAQCLLRIGEAPDQHDLPRDLRLNNLMSSFVLHPGFSAQVAGQRILLVDDVCTTGTTLQRAAWPLREAGAASISALAVARTQDG